MSQNESVLITDRSGIRNDARKMPTGDVARTFADIVSVKLGDQAEGVVGCYGAINRSGPSPGKISKP